ncbi:MAG: hypothetical protein Ct9H300mP1_31030 [Planctomycetaceae bacterium]|nr:MAG: hypothetical protein Ct9H300mP1_31030 [Planctomycetaceae bacterium]
MKGNPYGAKGQPTSKNWFGTYKTGFDVFASMVHGTESPCWWGLSPPASRDDRNHAGSHAGYMGGSLTW